MHKVVSPAGTVTRPSLFGIAFDLLPGEIFGPFETATDADRYLAVSADDMPGRVAPCHPQNVTTDPWGAPCAGDPVLTVYATRSYDGAPVERGTVTVPGLAT